MFVIPGIQKLRGKILLQSRGMARRGGVLANHQAWNEWVDARGHFVVDRPQPGGHLLSRDHRLALPAEEDHLGPRLHSGDRRDIRRGVRAM